MLTDWLRDQMVPIFRLADPFGIDGAEDEVTKGLLLLVEPGTFIMEQKMLRTIRDRVESSTA